MAEKKTDLLSKGAIVQNDYETYAIAPHFPGGICTPDDLRKIADAAEKYNAKLLKCTSAQRIAIVGLKEEDLDNIWADLKIKPAAAIGLCVRSVKFCPGNTFCKYGITDSVGIGKELDEKYHGMELPSKFKIGVSGCPKCCAESWVKDLGLIGMSKGWKVVIGGNAGAAPKVAQLLCSGLDDDKVLDVVAKIISYYKSHSKRERLNKFINSVGIDKIKEEIGL